MGSKKKKKRRKEKARGHGNIVQDYRWFIDALVRESDRGCILVAQSTLDNALEELLRAKFESSSKSNPELHDKLLTKRPLPPLGSFHVRGVISYVLGLIDENIFKALEEITGIRNELAHGVEPVELKEEDISGLMSWLPKSILMSANNYADLIMVRKEKVQEKGEMQGMAVYIDNSAWLNFTRARAHLAWAVSHILTEIVNKKDSLQSQSRSSDADSDA